ncbi:hypothetical protein HDU91_000719, partial [Kappamyces sp. JEL0680]
VTLVNFHGTVIYDEYVLPQEPVLDYRTAVSGITPNVLREKGRPFKEVQKEVAAIIKDKVIIGHDLRNDLNVLMLDHPGKLIRDTARYKPLKHPATKNPQSLRALAVQVLGKDIQSGTHCSIEDAVTSVEIYKRHKNEWEQTMFRKEKIQLKPHSW